ncbi:hypothetical protein [Rhizobium sp. Rhizsp82]|uniref:hypothetical protein n=1 Tax=Rhizobium sp. Rhizsp82 TaxID=3243057 RepID=UPI0039B42D27
MKILVVFSLILITALGCTNRSQEGSMTDTGIALQNTPQHGMSIGRQLDRQHMR